MKNSIEAALCRKLCRYFCASLQPQAIMGDAGIFTILWKYSHILQNWQIDKKEMGNLYFALKTFNVFINCEHLRHYGR